MIGNCITKCIHCISTPDTALLIRRWDYDKFKNIKEIKIGKVIREDDEYKVLDMDKDGNVISVKSLEDLLEDFVDLEGTNIKIEYIDKVDR